MQHPNTAPTCNSHRQHPTATRTDSSEPGYLKDSHAAASCNTCRQHLQATLTGDDEPSYLKNRHATAACNTYMHHPKATRTGNRDARHLKDAHATHATLACDTCRQRRGRLLGGPDSTRGQQAGDVRRGQAVGQQRPLGGCAVHDPRGQGAE
eukprot:363362-Chlamydomonas_euryale.AAC.20